MNHLLFIALLTLGIAASSMSCTKAASPRPDNTAEGERDNNDRAITTKMKIKIGSRTFTATLFDNPTATKLKAMLPLTLDMSELNGNEKYFHFSINLPTDASNPGTIRTGDLMLWGPTVWCFSTKHSRPLTVTPSSGASKIQLSFRPESVQEM